MPSAKISRTAFYSKFGLCNFMQVLIDMNVSITIGLKLAVIIDPLRNIMNEKKN